MLTGWVFVAQTIGEALSTLETIEPVEIDPFSLTQIGRCKPCYVAASPNAEAESIDGVRRSRQVRHGDLLTTIWEVLSGVR